jgi:CO dehydrogenase maturation factor
LLGTLESDGRVVVADLEAGMGTLTRMGERRVDVVLVVVEPTAKSIEVGSRIAGYVRERDLGRLVVVANRVRGEEDLARIGAAIPGEELVAVPDDPCIVQADRDGVAPLDLDPGAPAVVALVRLAESLLAEAAA